MPDVLALLVGDPPAVWDDLGFAVTEGVAWVDGVALALGGELKGIRAWSLDDVDEIPSMATPPAPVPPIPAPVMAAVGVPNPHRNGVVSLDHIVLATPDLERTITALETAGFGLRRRRHAGATYDRPLQQAFFRVGPTILEVIGTPGWQGEGTPRFFGLAFTVSDLDATTAYFGTRLHPAKEAVQPGRSIATLDRGAGSTVALAFMSPPPPGAGPGPSDESGESAIEEAE